METSNPVFCPLVGALLQSRRKKAVKGSSSRGDPDRSDASGMTDRQAAGTRLRNIIIMDRAFSDGPVCPTVVVDYLSSDRADQDT